MVKVSSGQVDLKEMSASSRNRIKDWGLTRFAQAFMGRYSCLPEKPATSK